MSTKTETPKQPWQKPEVKEPETNVVPAQDKSEEQKITEVKTVTISTENLPSVTVDKQEGLTVKLKKLKQDAVTPQYATDGSACFDITALEILKDNPNENSITYSTGLSFEIPKDHVMLVFSRSGHGFKENVRLANCVGIVDSDYRGELFVKLVKDNSVSVIQPSRGERVAQGLVLPVSQVIFTEVEELNETSRGENGLGSTGK